MAVISLPPRSAEEVRALLDYDPDTGVFTSKRTGNRTGAKVKSGYVYVSLGHRHCHGLAHRVAWLYEHGVWPAVQVDHINGNRSDNRLCNLRVVTPRVNSQNRQAQQANNKVGLLGVTRHEHKFRATIVVSGKQVSLGRFGTPDEAHAAYVAAKRRLHAGNTL